MEIVTNHAPAVNLLPQADFTPAPPPFNSRYSIPLSGKGYNNPANELMADALASINRPLAHRIRCCRRGLRCRARKYCASCSDIQREMFRRKFEPRLKFSAVHLTLTMQSHFHLYRTDLVALTNAFNRLKKRERFKHAVRGGVVNFQVEHGAHGWLPHLHAILDQQGELSIRWIKKTWTNLSGGWSVKIQPITPGTQSRVLAYGARKPDLPLDPNLLREFYQATSCFISIRAWGTLNPLHGRTPCRGAKQPVRSPQ